MKARHHSLIRFNGPVKTPHQDFTVSHAVFVKTPWSCFTLVDTSQKSRILIVIKVEDSTGWSLFYFKLLSLIVFLVFLKHVSACLEFRGRVCVRMCWRDFVCVRVRVLISFTLAWLRGSGWVWRHPLRSVTPFSEQSGFLLLSDTYCSTASFVLAACGRELWLN